MERVCGDYSTCKEWNNNQNMTNHDQSHTPLVARERREEEEYCRFVFAPPPYFIS